MSRYRSPQPAKSPYITAAGFALLEQESRDLWRYRREVVAALAAAAAEGDRSENAEYIYRKKQLREMDYRIRYLQKRVPALQVVNAPPADSNRVFFGAWITLEDEDGGEQIYRIVGADEFDPKQGWISVDSPVARALLNRGLDELVRVTTPNGQREFMITEIRYGD